MAELPLVFLAFANVEQDYLPLLNEEADSIFEALEGLHEEGCLEIRPRTAASLAKISAVFSKGWKRLEVFHYAGHAGKAEIHLTDGSKNAGGIAHMMRSLEALKLVFLNGCATKEQVKAMWKNGVKVVIATAVPIEDGKAKVFASQFYQNLGNGQSIKSAFEAAVGFLESDPQYAMDEFPKVRAFDKLAEEMDNDDIPWGLYCNPAEPEALNYKLPRKAPEREIMAIPVDPQKERFQEHLEKLNFYQQSKLMRRYLNRYDLGIFVIHGPEGHGQTWLCNNRFTKMHEARRLKIPNAIKMGRRISDVISLVKEINRVMLLDKWEYDNLEAAIAGLGLQFLEILKTQSIVLRVSKVSEYLQNQFLENFVAQFWKPFCKRLIELQGEGEVEDYQKVIVLFIENQEILAADYPNLFEKHLIAEIPNQLDTSKILLLPPIPLVELDEFEKWVDSDLDDLTKSVFKASKIETLSNDGKLEEFLDSDAGMPPEDLMIKVSEEIGFYLDPNDKGEWELTRLD